MSDSTRLDLRALPHGERHGLVFATVLALEPGQAAEIVNDHDPKPLSYMLAAEHPGEFSWTYLQEGPVDWRVRIGRRGEAPTGDATDARTAGEDTAAA